MPPLIGTPPRQLPDHRDRAGEGASDGRGVHEHQAAGHECEGNNCLELATAPDGTIRLRESDAPAGTLAFPAPALATLLAAMRQQSLVQAIRD
ncbi:DUF397 domain-containing protein [Streptomyces bluensis]|uniref:DUF397 domain-containing protein n=1 Tax=Streptomyces bluensis TaxID=33897 RepID=A0ABW6UQU6_9ACTN